MVLFYYQNSTIITIESNKLLNMWSHYMSTISPSILLSYDLTSYRGLLRSFNTMHHRTTRTDTF